MKLLIQRVKKAHVDVGNQTIGSIDHGLLIFLGIHIDDGPASIPWLVDKVINLRIFEDDNQKMNLSLLDTKGSILLISQFTLYGDCQKGRRPSFTQAAPPKISEPLYEEFISELKTHPISVETGQFGAEMQVHLINDGPVTLTLEK